MAEALSKVGIKAGRYKGTLPQAL